MRTRLKHTVSVIALASLLLSQHSAHAVGIEDRLEPVVRGEVIRDFARITFEWPREVYISSAVQGKVLTLKFDHGANPDFGPLLSSLSPHITRAELTGDGKTVRLTLDKPHRIRSFVSGNISGVDVLGIDPATQAAKPQAPTGTTLESPFMEVEAEEPRPAPQLPSRSRAVGAAPIQSVKSYALLAPKAGAQAPTPAAAEAPKPEAAAAPAAKKPAAAPEPAETAQTAPAAPKVEKPAAAEAAPSEPIVEVPTIAKVEEPTPKAEAVAEAPQEKKTEAPAAAAVPAVQTAAEAARKPAAPAAAPEAPATAQRIPEPPPPTPNTPADVAKASVDKTTLRPFSSMADGRPTLRFPWTERVALATFTRGPTLWLVFNRGVKMDMEAVRQKTPELASNIQTYTKGNASVIRVSIPATGGASVAKDKDSFEWRVTVLPIAQPPANPLRVDVNTEPPVPPHVFVPELEIAEPITLKDPEIGDELIVTPFYTPADGVSPRRRFVDFALLDSTTGLAVQKLVDDVVVQPQRSGVRVTTERGANLTPGLPSHAQPPESKEAVKPKEGQYSSLEGTLFPYNDWKPAEGETLVKQVQVLLRAISMSKSSEDAMRLRIRLAQLYLSEGMATETLSVLSQIRRIDSQLYAHARLGALAGAANYLLSRFAEADESFAAQELQELPETAYWRSMLSELLGKPDETFDYLAYYENFIRKYPPLLKQRLAITAADRAVGTTDYNNALRILDTLKESDIAGSGESYVTYLMAKIAVETGKTVEGMTSWHALAQDYAHDFVRVRAEFSLIGQQLKQNDINVDNVIDRLERLRLSWRGDAMEMNVLTFLGDLYEQKSDYLNAMKTWRNIVRSFPDTAAASDAEGKMRKAFVELFDKGMISVLPLIDQVALYYEFRDLTPTDSTGDRIVMGLVDRLIALDLLDQAGTILDQRVHFTYEQETRSRAGAKLARIHIMNRRWQKALDALQASVYGNNPEDLRSDRDRLAANAMAELGRSDEAMKLLARDKTEEAEDIRLRSWWKQKDWPKVIESVEEYLKTRRDTTKPLTPKETEKVMQLALAYLAEQDTAQLQYLRDYFSPLLKDGPRFALFDFITRPNIPATPPLFADMMAQVDETQAFLKNYNIRDRGKDLFPAELAAQLPPITPPPPAPAPAVPALEPVKENGAAKEAVPAAQEPAKAD